MGRQKDRRPFSLAGNKRHGHTESIRETGEIHSFLIGRQLVVFYRRDYRLRQTAGIPGNNENG